MTFKSLYIKSSSILVQIFSGIIDASLLVDISSNILKLVPNAKIIGATTDGEILENQVSTNKIIISFSLFKKSEVKISYIDNINLLDSYDAGIKIAKTRMENIMFCLLTYRAF